MTAERDQAQHHRPSDLKSNALSTRPLPASNSFKLEGVSVNSFRLLKNKTQTNITEKYSQQHFMDVASTNLKQKQVPEASCAKARERTLSSRVYLFARAFIVWTTSSYTHEVQNNKIVEQRSEILQNIKCKPFYQFSSSLTILFFPLRARRKTQLLLKNFYVLHR